MTADDPLLTPREAGLQLRRSDKYVRLLAQTGKLRHIATTGPGGQARYLIPQSAIDEYLRAHTVRRIA